MITKGIIVRKINNTSYEVDVPSLSDYDVQTSVVASVCSTINSNSNYKNNDVVFIAFENNRLEEPVILGALISDKFNSIDSNVELNSISVDGIIKLAASTEIGSVQKNDLSNLHGLTNNIQTSLDSIDNNFNFIDDFIDSNNKEILNNLTKLNDLNDELLILQNALDKMKQSIGTKDDKTTTTIYGRYNIISEDINKMSSFLSNLPNNKTAVEVINDTLKKLEEK